MKNLSQKAKSAGADMGIGVLAAIAGLTLMQKVNNKFVGPVMVAGSLALHFTGNEMLKTASVVTGSLGLVKTLNQAQEVAFIPLPVKNVLSKVVPTLNGTGGMGNIPFLGLGYTRETPALPESTFAAAPESNPTLNLLGLDNPMMVESAFV